MVDPKGATSDDLVDAIELVLRDEPIALPNGIRITGAFYRKGKTWLYCDGFADADHVRIDHLNDLHPSAPGALYRAIAAVDDKELKELRAERTARLEGELDELTKEQGSPYGQW